MTNPYQNLWGNNVIGEGTRIGAYCEIGNATIGCDCSIQAFCYICPGTVIGDRVFMGPRVTILNDKYPPSKREHWEGVTIHDGASIGGGVTILPGVTIGANAMIGAGSVVTKDVSAGEVWQGNPCRPTGELRGTIVKADREFVGL